jgi:EpsI family protein
MRTRIIVVFVCLMAAAVAVARADRYEEQPLRTSLALFPMQFGEWTGYQQPPFTDRVLEVLGLDDYLTRAYVGPDRKGVGLYIGYWKSQRQGDSIHSPLNCLPGAGWEPVEQSMLEIPDPRTPGAPPVVVNRYIVQKGLERQLILYWYQSRSRIVASEYWSKFYLVADAVRFNRTDGAIVRIVAPISGTGREAEPNAERLALRFINELLPKLDAFLPV